MRKWTVVSLILLVTLAVNAFAVGEARLAGKVIDGTTKQPIENVVITVESVEAKNIRQEAKTKKDGSYTVFLLDGTIRYKYTFSAPGYAPFEDVMKLQLGATNRRDIELFKGGAPAAAGVAPVKADASVDAYNAGAALANSGDYAGAIAKFEEAVAGKPDLTAGWIALARTALKAKNYPRAIVAAKKVLEVDDEDTAMWSVLHTAYTATGDTASAAVAQKKLPASAPTLFNQAAELINKGNDTAAEAALKQAIAIDDSMSAAYYQLAMIYVRASKNSEARAAFTKYLELDPNGADAPTAKEMLNYLQ